MTVAEGDALFEDDGHMEDDNPFGMEEEKTTNEPEPTAPANVHIKADEDELLSDSGSDLGDWENISAEEIAALGLRPPDALTDPFKDKWKLIK